MLSEAEEPRDAESESSGDEDNSIGWLEALAEEPAAIWDGKTAPSPESREDLPSQPDQDSDQASAGESDKENADWNEAEAKPEQTRDETVSAPSGWTGEDSVLGRQSPENNSDPTSYSDDQIGEHDLGSEVILENDDLMWLDEMDTAPKMSSNAQERDEEQLTGVPGEPVDEMNQDQDTNESAAGEANSAVSDEVPEDPDEAVAWLERLAAKQGAPSEELPTVQSAVSLDAELALPADAEFELPPDDAGEIPEDPDEAMAWLERLAAKQGVDADELTTVQPSEELAQPLPSVELDDIAEVQTGEESPIADLDEALDWLEELTVQPRPSEEEEAEAAVIPVSEEPPTPAVVHDVAEAMAGADLLFAEPESAPSTEAAGEVVDESTRGEGGDAMAWLEQLAARQGAPIEELTTFEEEEVAGQVQPETPQVATVEMGEQIDAGELAQVSELKEAPADSVEPADALAADEFVDLSAHDVADEAAAEAEDSMAEEDSPSEDLAWLDTLGHVDAESWLEAEAEVEQIETVTESNEAPLIESLEMSEEDMVEAGALATIPPEAHGAEELAQAREAMQEGSIEEGLAVYSVLVEQGESLPFLIDYLENFYEERGPEPRLQRVLGDAYARNGQLQKALRVYREALDYL
jgi:tetratricopeptide (TPR) repeat protein